MDSIFNKLIRVSADTTDINSKLVPDLAKAQAALNSLGKRTETAIGMTTKMIPTMDKMGNVVNKTMNTISTESGKSFTLMTGGMNKASGASNDFLNVLKRAALVAPLWMAVRGAMQLVMSTIQEGIKNWVDFDAALMKSKAVVHGFVGDSSIAIGILRERIVEFSKESGIAVEKLASAFYRFGTVGVKFEDAMEGAFASAKLAKATMGDTDTIARALAMTYNLLGDTMDASLSPAEKMNQIAGITYKLWQKNAFETNEFAAALQGFVGTANIANFTISQTEVLLASLGTAGVIGAKGGTLLKTAIFQLIQHLDKLAPALGVGISAGETMHDTFRRVVDTLAEMSKTGTTPPETLKAISEIFGGVRGGQVVSALVAVNRELKENDEVVKNASGAAEELNKRYQEVIDSLSGSAERISNYKKLIGEVFVKAIVGGDSFEQSLKNIADTMENDVIPGVQTLAKIFQWFGTGIAPLQAAANSTQELKTSMQEIVELRKSMQVIAEKTKENLSTTEIEDLRKNLTSIALLLDRKIANMNATFSTQMMNEGDLDIQLNIMLRMLDEKERLSKLSDEEKKKEIEITAAQEKQLSYNQQLYELQKDLTGYKDKLKYIQMATDGTDKLVIAQEKSRDAVKELVDFYNKLKMPSGGEKSPINIESTITLLKNAIKGEGEGGLRITDVLSKYFAAAGEIKNITEFKNAINAVNESMVAEIEYSAKIIPAELELLKIRGASNLQLVEAEYKLKGMTGTLDYRLAKEKAITQELTNQNNMSSRAMKIYEIAKKYGTGVAEDIGGALQGRQGGLKNLSAANQAIFKKEMPSEEKQFQAQEFYKDESYLRTLMMPQNIPALSDLRGKYGISEGTPSGGVQKREIKLTIAVQSETSVGIADVQGTTKDANIEKIKDEIVRDIKSPLGKIHRAMHDDMEGGQL